jgi:CheY-like chemotaxis protein
MAAFPNTQPLVLIVEDEALLRLHAAAIFEEAGFATIETSTADAAVAILEAGNDIQVIFTDIEMPGTMNGLRFALLVRDRWPPVGIILTSGKVNIPKGELPADLVFFPKPYDSRTLVETAKKMAA